MFVPLQVVLLIYTVIPLPLYLCILIGLVYSCLFEMLSRNRITYGDVSHIQLVLHIGVHLLGVHLFILTQVRCCFFVILRLSTTGNFFCFLMFGALLPQLVRVPFPVPHRDSVATDLPARAHAANQGCA